jgi:hypothetical protein
MDLREELIQIQKRLARRLKKEIRHYVREDTPLLERYRREYEQELKSYSRIASQRELVEAVKEADIVYCGDYHTLAQAQRTPLRILEQVIKERKEIILCLEVVMAKHQNHLDDYLADKITETEFLKRIDYAHTWGFTWSRYKPFFDFAKKEKIPVVAINSAPRGIKDRLERRDKRAAHIIAEQTRQNPSALVFVIDGDWHIAYPHLPRQVELALKKYKLTRKTVTIFQNSEKIYWQLVKYRLEHRVDVVQICKSKYCVINTTPTVKLRSYLNWAEEADELSYATLWKTEQSTLSIEDELLMIINLIADFFDLPKQGMEDFSVYSSADLDFLETLIRKRHFTYPEIQEIKHQIESDESYYIKKGHIIYLSNLSINHAAEEATHFINHILAGEFATYEDSREVFYQQVLAESLGFLGSKIVNQRRRCYTPADFAYFLKEYSREKKRDSEIVRLQVIAKHVLRHRKLETQKSERLNEKSPFYKSLLNEKPEIRNAVAHSLGYLLGNSLYYGLMKNKIEKEEVRKLFLENFKQRKPSEVYLGLSTTLQKAGVFDIYEDTDDLLCEDVITNA